MFSNLIGASTKLTIAALVVVFGLMFVAASVSGNGVDSISLHSLLELAASF